MLSLEQSKLIKQIYFNENESIYSPIKLNTTTRIMEMLPKYHKRIITHRNKMIENRIFIANARQDTTTRLCPMKYSQVICHACHEEIAIRNLYLSKNGEHGRSKFYHVHCAEIKNII